MLAGAHAEENKNEIVHIYHLTTDWLVRLTFPLVLFLAVFANDLLILFGPTFAKEGTLLLQLLLLAQLINLGCGPLGNVLNMCGLEREKFVATIIASIVGAVIMAWGAYSMGILGVGIGIASVILLGNTFSILIAKWKMQLSWWDKRYKKWWIPMLANSSIVMMFGLFGSDMGIPGLVAMLVISYISFHGIYFIFGKNEDDVIILDAVKRRMNYGNR
jgi:O-antigen/teichoic acid export membrane protein